MHQVETPTGILPTLHKIIARLDFLEGGGEEKEGRSRCSPRRDFPVDRHRPCKGIPCRIPAGLQATAPRSNQNTSQKMGRSASSGVRRIFKKMGTRKPGTTLTLHEALPPGKEGTSFPRGDQLRTSGQYSIGLVKDERKGGEVGTPERGHQPLDTKLC
jgi:hypothetical protein